MTAGTGGHTPNNPPAGRGMAGWLESLHDLFTSSGITISEGNVHVDNFPDDYPNDALQTTAEAVLAELQDIDAKLISGSQKTQIVGAVTIANSLITVGGAVTVNAVLGSVSIVGAVTVNNNPGAVVQAQMAAALTTIAAAQTNSNQKTQLVGGLNAATAATIDSTGSIRTAQSELIMAAITVTTASDTIAIDGDGYQWATVSWSGGAAFAGNPQVSPDGVNRWNATYYDSYLGAAGLPVIGAFNIATGIIRVPLNERFLRMHLTNVSGTYALIVTLHAGPFPGWTAINAVQSGTYTVSGTATVTQGAGIGTNTPWGVGGTNIGTSNNASTTAVAGTILTYINCEAFFGATVVVAGGTLSALSLVVEGSDDAGVNWFLISTYTGLTSNYVVNAAPMPFIAVRTRIASLTVLTGTPTITTRIGATV